MIYNKKQCSYCGLETFCLTLLAIKLDPSVSDLSYFDPMVKDITGLAGTNLWLCVSN